MSDVDWYTMHDEATTILTGEFPVTITKAEAKKSQGGKPQFKLSLAIEEGPHAGRKIPTSLTVSAESPVAMRIFFQTLEVLGLDKAFFATRPNPEAIAAALVGRRAVVVIASESFGNRPPTESVKTWKAAEGGPGEGLSLGGLGAATPLSGIESFPTEVDPFSTPERPETGTAMPEDPFAID